MIQKRISFVIVLLTAFALGQTKTAKPTNPLHVARQSSSASQVGRYQLFFSPLARADVYLVDTETGRIWKPITISNAKDSNLKNSAPEVWLYQDRIDSEADFDAWQMLHTSAAPAQTTPQK